MVLESANPAVVSEWLKFEEVTKDADHVNCRPGPRKPDICARCRLEQVWLDSVTWMGEVNDALAATT